MATSALLPPRVLRLPRVEQNSEPACVMLHVESDGGDGSRPLNLKLIGTDSSEVFALSLKQSKTSTLKAKNSKIPQDEWDAILAAILLEDVPEDAGFLEGVEAVTEVVEGTSMTITIQKRIEGITQRLGQIILAVFEDEDGIDLFDWCSLIIKSKNDLLTSITTYKNTLIHKDSQIQKLEAALSELTLLKNENEDQLLEKFSLLLNEKKLKIRDQQRLLAAADIDGVSPSGGGGKVEEMDVDLDLEKPTTKAGPSRAKKRKAVAKAVVESDSDDDGPAAPMVKMEIDEPDLADDSDKADERTASESETESDDSDTAPPPLPLAQGKGKGKAKAVSPPPLPKAKAKAKAKEITPPPRRSTRGASAQPEKKKVPEKEKNSDDIDDDDDELPPPRALPTSMRPPVKKTVAPPPPQPSLEGSETESDDEL